MEVNANVKVTSHDSLTISIPTQPTSNLVTVAYHTLNGNNPADNGNYLGLWQSNNGIIPRTKAIWSEKITKTETDSKIVCKMPINDNGFIVGYCQTGDPKLNEAAALNVSASAVIAQTGNMGAQTSALLDITGDTTSAVLKYSLLKNTRCDGHWFGIWEENAAIGADVPIYSNTIASGDPDKSGTVILDDVSFTRGMSYTLAYFVAGYDCKNPDTSKMLAYIEFTF